MKKNKKIVCVIGTRPEAIKMAPIILKLKSESWVDVKVLATAQHRHLLDQVNCFFGIVPDVDLNTMIPNQSLSSLTSKLIEKLDTYLLVEKPDAVLIQGDTTTVLAMSLVCFYHQIPIGHVEAGLRTWDLLNPFPEEANRTIAGKLARWHFAPTTIACDNLLKEGVSMDCITITGNTVIDSLFVAVENISKIHGLAESNRKRILVTTHRRENFGKPLENILHALRELAISNPDVDFLFPVHPNPNVTGLATNYLSDLKNVVLSKPLSYPEFVYELKRSYFVITDSGGVQEEAPALGKPVLVLRDTTERPEAVNLGVAKLIGTKKDIIISEVQTLLDDKQKYTTMAKGVSPYGDGLASERILNFLKNYFGINKFAS